MKYQTIIIDFDSTIITSESLEDLAEVVLEGREDKDSILRRIAEITTRGMSGELSFEESLSSRMKLLSFSKDDLKNLIEVLKSKITPSFSANTDFIKKYSGSIHVISGGFADYIVPVVTKLGVKAENVHANTFIYDGEQIAGYDTSNPLAKNGGKSKTILALGLTGPTCVIGDGYTDLEIKLANAAEDFFAFTGNVKRPSVSKSADFTISSFDEFIEHCKIGGW